MIETNSNSSTQIPPLTPLSPQQLPRWTDTTTAVSHPTDAFSIVKTGERHSTKFNKTCLLYKLDMKENFDGMQDLHKAFDWLIQSVFAKATPNAKVGVVIDHPLLKLGKAIIPFCNKEDLSVGKLSTFMEKLSQSNEEIPLSSFQIEAVIVEPPNNDK